MSKGKIILLNGVSSSGKSTLSKELVNKLPYYFHFSIDDFDTIIERMEDRENQRLIPVETEYFFHRTIAMFLDRGVNLIVDQIIHDEFTRKDIYEVLKGYPVLIVGINCPVEELERREKVRGDRNIGQARSQLDYVHKYEMYDITVDTYTEGLEECVNRIVEAVKNDYFSYEWLKKSI